MSRPERSLENALLFSAFAHAAGMASMALLLLPGMPGGGVEDIAARAAHVAASPWWWRLGWFPWQVTAASDLWIGIALLRCRWVPRGAAAIGLVLTIAAVIPDQLGQALWITRGVDLATAAVDMGDPAAYSAFETRAFELTGAWGATLYTFAAIGWTVSLRRAGVWSRALSWLSWPLWALFAWVSVAPFVPPALRASPAVVAVGNAVGFVGLEVWLVLVLEKVLTRARPDEVVGRLAPWRHPRGGVLGALAELIANSRVARRVAELAPPVAFASDLQDVLYVSYLVPAERVARFVPPGLELQRLGPQGACALLTFLSYRHGHFGPALFGPLRRLLPSPVHTNWRIHVRDPRTGREGIFFLTNAITMAPHALAARLLSEGMPMHLLARGVVRATPDGGYRLELDPGRGSAPDAVATLRPAAHPPEMAGPWKECFGTFRGLLEYCVPQDRAMSTQPWNGTVTRQEIELGIPLEACQPLEGEVTSSAAAAYGGTTAPICFRVPAVRFRFDREERDRL